MYIFKFFNNKSKDYIFKSHVKLLINIQKMFGNNKFLKNLYTINGEPILSIYDIPNLDKVIFICKIIN